MLADAPNATAGTAAEHKSGGFPPFDTATYPSQLFWLVVIFVALLAVMWKVAVPKIGGVIAERKGRIQTELAKAEESRKQAEHAAAAYQAPILEARERARAASEQTRTQMQQEFERAKQSADTETQRKTTEAQERIAALQRQAKWHVTQAAEDAVVEIVNRLTGETVSRDEATAAVRDVLKA
ncbi:MAG: F0F1 ATP synthase subunit B' [Alphaproteobacteria bacterium]|nr:F0F1 ATP synthase subunit B' [Alphaproteobacteria bacterium]MBV9062345.1 F0F1 ATP synthase subunit B' [Alphaproteobacteria bacterium]